MSLVPWGGNKVSPNPSLIDSYPDVYLATAWSPENHARESGISRAEQDASRCAATSARFAARSTRAASRKRFVPVTAKLVGTQNAELRSENSDPTFAVRRRPRRDTSPEALAKLRPALTPPVASRPV